MKFVVKDVQYSFRPRTNALSSPESRSAAETTWLAPGRALTLRISDWLLRSRGILMGSWKQHLPQHWQHSDMLVATHDTTRHDSYARHTTSISRLTERYFGHELYSTTSTTSTSILFLYSTLLYLVISALRSSMVAEGDITVFWSNANQNYLSVVWSLSSEWPGVIEGCLLLRFDIDNQI